MVKALHDHLMISCQSGESIGKLAARARIKREERIFKSSIAYEPAESQEEV
jgi:hypothetical protein